MAFRPEHDKLDKIKDLSQSTGEFLDWLQEQGIHLGEWKGSIMEPYRESVVSLLARFHGVNLDVLNREKNEALRELEQLHSGGDPPRFLTVDEILAGETSIT